MQTHKYLAELVGTFLFMSIGYASVAAFGGVDVPGLLVVPFSFGLGLLAAIFAVGHISGGHFNPAVSIAMVLDGRISPLDAVGYIVAQVIGAIAAGAVILVAVSQDAVAAGITAPGSGVTEVGAVILEILFTAAFLATILASTKRAPALAPLAIPLTLIAIHFATATLSGASVNPARSLGSALIGGDLSAIWIYLVGPVVGAAVGWGIWRVVDGGGEEPAAA